MTARQAARYLGISTATLRQHIEAGVIPVWVDPFTHRRRYERLALDAWRTNVSQDNQRNQQ